VEVMSFVIEDVVGSQTPNVLQEVPPGR